MAGTVTFTLEINNEIHSTECCGNNRREIETMSNNFRYQVLKMKADKDIKSYSIYYEIASKNEE